MPYQGTITCTCVVCGKTFFAYPYRASKAQFCSVPCAHVAAKGRQRPPRTEEHAAKLRASTTAYHAARKKPRPMCTDCGVEIGLKSKRCSPCAHAFRASNLTPEKRAAISVRSRSNWDHPEYRARVTEKIRVNRRSPEFLEKVSGDRHYNWRGGRTEANKKRIHTKQWKAFRRGYLACHPNICEVCSVPAKVLHHRIPVIVWPDGEFVESNIQVVCQSCHSKIEHALSVHPLVQ